MKSLTQEDTSFNENSISCKNCQMTFLQTYLPGIFAQHQIFDLKLKLFTSPIPDCVKRQFIFLVLLVVTPVPESDSVESDDDSGTGVVQICDP